jgi:hypothetical protein
MPDPEKIEPLRLLNNQARIIELETTQAPAIRYSLPFWDYADDLGLRVRIFYPGFPPHANIRLETYKLNPNHDPNAGANPPDPIMLPHQPDEPLRIDGEAIDPLYAAMVLFFNRPVPGPVAPPNDVAALVLCRHEPPLEHTDVTRQDCLNVYKAQAVEINRTWYRIVPA